MRSKKPTISKNIPKRVICWIVKHPHGHIYSLPKLEPLIGQLGLSRSELELRGWTFEARNE